jgi:hypothetical protein
MKSKLPFVFLPLLFTTAFGAEGLYYTGTEAQESLPIKWLVGGNLIYDDNVNPTNQAAGQSVRDSSMAVNPYVGASFVSLAPQTTWDVYGRLGMIYYFDAPDSLGDDLNSQSRLGVSMIHRFSERVRFVSRNFVANELEPDYSYGMASSRQSSEFMSWSTDNSLGYRWTERFGTYTGIRFSGSSYGDDSQTGNSSDLSDRMYWQVYEQLRYQYSPQTVLVTEYRYGQTLTNSVASESTDQYFLVGADHRFSPNTIGTIRVGAQMRDVDGGSNTASPYLEFALNTQINPQLRLGSFMRYGMESDDTVLSPDGFTTASFNYDERNTLRFGLTGTYLISPDLSLNSGVDLIQSNYDSGRLVDGTAAGSAPSLSETTFNAYIGMSVKLTDFLYGNLSYNYSQTVSDVNDYREYDRNRVSVGVSAEF